MSAEGFVKHKIGDNEVSFFLGNYALERSLEEMKAPISDLSDMLNMKFLPFVRHYMYYSAEYYATEIAGAEFTYVPKDTFKWIDQTGGVNGEFYLKFTKELFRALGLSSVVDENTTALPEKKNQLKK